MYPRYSFTDALNEYAIRFFALLDNGYRIKNRNYLMLVNIFCVPDMEESARKDFLRKLEFATQDPSDILKPSDDETDMNALAKMLG